MMNSPTYNQTRSALKTYFDRTAVEAWARLTSDAKVSGIRETVRQGREQMRTQLINWLPADLSGFRLFDAGCGTGALSVDAARCGANVTAVDLSPTLVNLARERLPANIGHGRITFATGDMLAPETTGLPDRFDYIVAMDSLIHYAPGDVVHALEQLAARADRAVLFTFAPWTPLLAVMHHIGRAFPRSNRAPAIVPNRLSALTAAIESAPGLRGWQVGRTHRVDSGFYISQALEITKSREGRAK